MVYLIVNLSLVDPGCCCCMKVAKSPNELLALTNCAIVNSADIFAGQKFAKINGKLFSIKYGYIKESLKLTFLELTTVSQLVTLVFLVFKESGYKFP